MTLSSLGAEPVAWSVGEIDVLWRRDPAVWPQTAPILFPIVGWARDGLIRHKGASYPLNVHGFAASQDFSLIAQESDAAHFRLTDNDSTRAVYPFAFQLDVFYRLEGNALFWRLEVCNSGPEIMPYAIGVHPGFCWPLAGSDSAHTFAFDCAERPFVPKIAPGGLFSAEQKLVPMTDGRLVLSDSLLADEALCFLNVASKGATLDNGQGAQIRCDFENFPHLALWARPPAPFLSIEAWTGHGDPEGFVGELSEKPSISLLKPGERAGHAVCFTFLSEQ